MGVDICAVVQVRRNGRWEGAPFEFSDNRHYKLYAWLAGVTNRAQIVPLDWPRGLPDDFEPTWPLDDVEADMLDACSWFSASELAAVDYDQIVEDRVVAVRMPQGYINHGATCEPGMGKFVPLKEFLGEPAMKDILKIIGLGDARLVFCFDF